MNESTIDRPKVRRNKKDRVPVNGNERNILTVNNRDPAFYYRHVLNRPDRIAKFKEAWYEPVEADADTRVGDRKIDTTAGTSSLVETRAGAGEKYILMRLPIELWKEDQDRKHKKIDETEADMMRQAKNERYGRLEIDRSGKLDAPIES